MSDQKKSNNGSNHGTSDGLNDADIKHLFEQQNSEPPQALDELILAAAKSTDKVLPNASKPTRFSQKYTAAFGLAAMVLLAVVIVPLMTKQPEYTLDANNTSIEESDEMPITADLKTEFADAQEASGGGDAGNTMAEVSALTSATRSQQPIQAKRALKSAEVQAESATVQLSSEPSASPTASTARKSIPTQPSVLSNEVTQEERESPQKWIEAINRLFEQNNLTVAKTELARFRQKHPDNEHEALLPAALREQTSTD